MFKCESYIFGEAFSLYFTLFLVFLRLLFSGIHVSVLQVNSAL